MKIFNVNDVIFSFYNFLFLGMRVLSFFIVAPLFSDSSIPKKVKLFFAFVISWFFMFLIPEVSINLLSIDGFIVLIEQILIGISLGFIMQLMFSTVKVSGELISFQMGLSFSSVLDWNTRSNISVLSRFLHVFFFLLFLEFNGHLWMISILFDFFLKIPINIIELDSTSFFKILIASKFIFIDGLMLVLPIIMIQLMLNISMGILNRIASQISIFSVGFSLTLLVGMYIFYLFIPIFPSIYHNIFNRLVFSISSFSREFL
ncbi:MAG: flagellar biosynthetic protein FliR [Buchnera aphidicola (Nurudea yanoniella)]